MRQLRPSQLEIPNAPDGGWSHWWRCALLDVRSTVSFIVFASWVTSLGNEGRCQPPVVYPVWAEIGQMTAGNCMLFDLPRLAAGDTLCIMSNVPSTYLFLGINVKSVFLWTLSTDSWFQQSAANRFQRLRRGGAQRLSRSIIPHYCQMTRRDWADWIEDLTWHVCNCQHSLTGLECP